MSSKPKRKTKQKDYPQYSITVFTKDGKMTGTSWFNSLPKAKIYMKQKLKSIDKEPKNIKVFVWRKGDTLSTVKHRNIKRL